MSNRKEVNLSFLKHELYKKMQGFEKNKQSQ